MLSRGRRENARVELSAQLFLNGSNFLKFSGNSELLPFVLPERS